jgi:hypothetical protein
MFNWLFGPPKPEPASPEEVQAIKNKVRTALQETKSEMLDNEIWKDQQVDRAFQKVKNALTEKESRQIGEITIGISPANRDIVAKFRGEKVNSFDASKYQKAFNVSSQIYEEAKDV